MSRNLAPDLRSYDLIVVNSSAGKDSQAMLDYVVALADEQGVRHRIRVYHADLGEIEWPGTAELAEEHARHYGLPFEKISRPQGNLLEHVEARGMWPSPTERYCTSDHKRGQIQKLIVAATRGIPNARVLNCLGFRSEESPARAKRRALASNKRASTKRNYNKKLKRWKARSRVVHDWLPIHDWTLAQVWARIKQAGTRRHYAYDLGMTRLSCRFCIFAPRSQLLISAKANPELFQKYVETEQRIEHKFRISLSLVDLQTAVAAGEEAASDDGCWNM